MNTNQMNAKIAEKMTSAEIVEWVETNTEINKTSRSYEKFSAFANDGSMNEYRKKNALMPLLKNMVVHTIMRDPIRENRPHSAVAECGWIEGLSIDDAAELISRRGW